MAITHIFERASTWIYEKNKINFSRMINVCCLINTFERAYGCVHSILPHWFLCSRCETNSIKKDPRNETVIIRLHRLYIYITFFPLKCYLFNWLNDKADYYYSYFYVTWATARNIIWFVVDSYENLFYVYSICENDIFKRTAGLRKQRKQRILIVEGVGAFDIYFMTMTCNWEI